jgi:hypothetical protein
VKTNLGQTKDEIRQIYGAMANTFTKLKSLPSKNVTLVSTKANISSDFIPSETELLKIMTDMYTQNASGGNA